MREQKSMHDAIKNFILDRECNKKEIILKSKFVKNKDGGLNKILLGKIQNSGKCKNAELKHRFEEIKKRKKKKEESSIEFQKSKYTKLIALCEDCGIDLSAIKDSYNKEKEKIEISHEFGRWLDDNCSNAQGASVATHISKLTHSSSKASCFFDRSNDSKKGYLSTSSLKKAVVDGAYDDAKYSPVVSLLLVENKGRFFYEDVIDEDFTALEGFTKVKDELNHWANELKKSIDKPIKSSDSLLKQIYFPIKDQSVNTKDYHLLSLLVSSAIAQEIFRKVGSKEAIANNKRIREKYKIKGKYSGDTLVNYPGKAVLKVTQSSHQNPSRLNAERSGQLFLLTCKPPLWQSQLKPPLDRKSWFDRGIPHSAVKDDIAYLRDFLLRFERLELSTRDPKRRRWIIKWVNRIITNVMFCAEGIQNLPAGWSDTSGIKLTPEQRYFLDPYRADEAFRAERKTSDWQSTVCADFATWLNRKLQGRDKKFTPQKEHNRLWRSLMEQPLRESTEMIDAVLGSQEEDA